MPVYLAVYLSVHPLVCLFPSIDLLVCVSVSVCLSNVCICLPICLSVHVHLYNQSNYGQFAVSYCSLIFCLLSTSLYYGYQRIRDRMDVGLSGVICVCT